MRRSVQHKKTSRVRRSASGYTLIEVMMSLAVLTVGASAIMGFQIAVLRGNAEARQVTTATAIASQWMERLKIDALTWGPATLSATTYLRNHTADGDWAAPTVASGDTLGAAYDYMGSPTTTDANMAFCVLTRLRTMYSGAAVRAEVRVWWARRPGNGTDGDLSDYAGCAGDPSDLETDDNVRTVQATSVITPTPPPTHG